ncbi:type IV secretion system protein VirB10 [Sphingomonas leidyi]|uniref:Type IV secretion system protein VirB10 n=1 Tax=Sphingomonas leidyi TaxID=68569 RepID=A0A7X5UXT6_9SPHN|nr:TrbI/VirB10 family protein [Sphingomonas leidyi]NIJ64269.1 type IV secretion system protein VirB10 [Sphingomonas leidyi]
MSEAEPPLAESPAPSPASPAAPANLRLRSDPPRVMRLSRKVLATLGVVAATGVGGALIYALQPSEKGVAEELYSTEGRATADGLNSAPKDYAEIPRLGPPLPGDLGGPIVSAQQRGETVPVPPIGAASPGGGPPSAADTARERAVQERDAARTSRLFLGAGAASAGAGAMLDPLAAAMPGFQGLPAPTPTAASDIAAANPQSEDSAQNGQTAKRAFLNPSADRNLTNTNRVVAAASPWVVQAGSVIPAALITGIRSDLPGQITAQVTENVYDSPTGRVLLIPQGARLIGEYDSQVSFGQNRVLLAWDRLILPGGRSIMLEREPGADAAGFAGLQDRTDYHWGSMLRAALTSTLLGVGSELGADDDGELTRALRRGSQDTINQSGQQIVRRQLNVQPTITIRPGYPLRVLVTRDLILPALVQEIRR